MPPPVAWGWMSISAGRWPGSLSWCGAVSVEYTLAELDVLLHPIDWSVQVLQVSARRAAERNEGAIACWREK